MNHDHCDSSNECNRDAPLYSDTFVAKKRWVISRKLGTSLIPRPATQPLEPLERVFCIMRPGSASQTILMHPPRGEQEEPPAWGWKKGLTVGVKIGSLLTIRPCSISQTIPIRPPASGGEQEEPLEGGRAAFTWTNGSVLKYYEPMVHNPDCSNVTPPEARKRTFDWGRQFGPWQSNSVHPHQNGLMFPKSDYSREEEKRIH